MAITLNNRPSVITPGFNQMMFKATSNQTAQPNFKYYIQINVDGNVLSPLVLPARPTGEVIFDIQPLVQDYLKNYFPINTYGWQQCTKSIINVTVNIGERYGTTPTIYPGVTETYTPYYASLSNEKMAIYISTAYSFISGALNGYGSTIRATTTDQLVFYWLLESAGELTTVRVRTYDTAGVLQSDSYIANPLTAASVANQFICIDLGLSGLAGLTAPQVTGDFPITVSGIGSIVYDFTNGSEVHTYTLNVEDCCNTGEELENTLYYVNSKGAFDHINFCTRVKEDLTATQTTYRPIEQYFKTSYRNSGGTLVNSSLPLNQNLKVLGNTYEKVKTFTSAPLTESEYTMLQDCFNSPAMILKRADNYEYISNQNLNFSFKKKVIEKVIQFVMTAKNNLIEKRQSHG